MCSDAKLVAETPAAVIKMWRSDYDNATAYSHSEHRHGLQFVNCAGVQLDGITVQQTGGDGVYFRNVTDVSARRVTVSGAYRNGVTIVSWSNVLLEDWVIDDVNGTAPRSGVDFEPNVADMVGNIAHLEELSNITLRRVAVSNVGGCGIEVKHAWAPDPDTPTPMTIFLDSCSVTGADRAGLAVAPVSPGAQGRIVVANMTVADTAARAL